MAAYYNEIEPYAAQWLRNLIAAGHIAQGEVDERSICDVDSADLAGFTQCHFFAGIGVWSRALRLAGWPDNRAVWTGSCPCQPFSAAGKRSGFDDERHLWPEFHRLIAECRPPVVFGEQVASKDGLGWLDLVSADMEATGYAFAAADLCAAGLGAPHIRQRLWWVADAERRAAERHGLALGTEARGSQGEIWPRSQWVRDDAGHGVNTGGVADAECFGRQWRQGAEDGREHDGEDAGWQQGYDGLVGGNEAVDGPQRPSPTNGHWADADWLHCRDGKWRPVEPGTFPLAHGAAARVGRLRAYGNAIVPQVAQAFIEAVMEARP